MTSKDRHPCRPSVLDHHDALAQPLLNSRAQIHASPRPARWITGNAGLELRVARRPLVSDPIFFIRAPTALFVTLVRHRSPPLTTPGSQTDAALDSLTVQPQATAARAPWARDAAPRCSATPATVGSFQRETARGGEGILPSRPVLDAVTLPHSVCASTHQCTSGMAYIPQVIMGSLTNARVGATAATSIKTGIGPGHGSSEVARSIAWASTSLFAGG